MTPNENILPIFLSKCIRWVSLSIKGLSNMSKEVLTLYGITDRWSIWRIFLYIQRRSELLIGMSFRYFTFHWAVSEPCIKNLEFISTNIWMITFASVSEKMRVLIPTIMIYKFSGEPSCCFLDVNFITVVLKTFT